MPDADKVKALELANGLGGAPAEVVARATAYLSFLTGTAAVKPAAAAKPATQAATKPAAAAEKPAAAATKAAAKPATQAATKPAPAAAAPKQVGKYGVEVTRAIIRQVGNTDGLGQQSARDILDEEAGVKAVSKAKPTDLDKIYEACVVALASVGAAPEGDALPAGARYDADDELEDPTA